MSDDNTKVFIEFLLCASDSGLSSFNLASRVDVILSPTSFITLMLLWEHQGTDIIKLDEGLEIMCRNAQGTHELPQADCEGFGKASPVLRICGHDRETWVSLCWEGVC